MVIDNKGYELCFIPELNKWKRRHIEVIKNQGINIPLGKHVHHVNGNKLDNRISNLTFVDRSEHALIHHKMRAEKDCGNSNYRKCYLCGKYDDPVYLYKESSGGHSHLYCRNEYLKEWQRRKRTGANTKHPGK